MSTYFGGSDFGTELEPALIPALGTPGAMARHMEPADRPLAPGALDLAGAPPAQSKSGPADRLPPLRHVRVRRRPVLAWKGSRPAFTRSISN